MSPAGRDSKMDDSLVAGSSGQLGAQIEAFEKAWQTGDAPVIDAYLVGDARERHTLLVELAHADLEFRLKRGEAARVELYLNRYPSLNVDGSAVLDLVETEYDMRRRNESNIAIDEFEQRFPVYGERLRRRLKRGLAPAHRKSQLNTNGSLPDSHAVPGYEIIRQIGKGGMGVIYQARQLKLKRHVALKFVPAELVQDRALLDRFVREAITVSSLNHPNICTIHELGEHHGRPFMVRRVPNPNATASRA